MNKIFIPILFLSSLLISCGSDDDGGSNEIEQPVISGEFEDTEESKIALEENALEALDKIEAFNNDAALQEIIELAEYLGDSSDDENTDDNVLDTALDSVDDLNETVINIGDLGVYEWNEEIGDFEKIEESDEQVFNIDYNGKNAVFSITEFSTSLNPDEVELPESVKSTLVIDGVTILEQTHTASLDDDSFLPNSFSNSIEIGELIFESSLANSGNNSITETTNFKIGDDTILYLGTKTDGDFNELNSTGSTESSIDEVLSSQEVTLSLLDASVTFDGALPENFDTDAESLDQSDIDALNEDIEIVLSVDNKLAATGEFYLDTETDETNVRFLFPDNSTADFDTYFNDNFTSVENKLESVFDLFSESTEDINL